MEKACIFAARKRGEAMRRRRYDGGLSGQVQTKKLKISLVVLKKYLLLQPLKGTGRQERKDKQGGQTGNKQTSSNKYLESSVLH